MLRKNALDYHRTIIEHGIIHFVYCKMSLGNKALIWPWLYEELLVQLTIILP